MHRLATHKSSVTFVVPPDFVCDKVLQELKLCFNQRYHKPAEYIEMSREGDNITVTYPREAYNFCEDIVRYFVRHTHPKLPLERDEMLLMTDFTIQRGYQHISYIDYLDVLLRYYESEYCMVDGNLSSLLEVYGDKYELTITYPKITKDFMCKVARTHGLIPLN